jgi:hypothetical protein
MAKKPVHTAPARGTWEITLRNLRALKKQLAALDVRVTALEREPPTDQPEDRAVSVDDL